MMFLSYSSLQPSYHTSSVRIFVRALLVFVLVLLLFLLLLLPLLCFSSSLFFFFFVVLLLFLFLFLFLLLLLLVVVVVVVVVGRNKDWDPVENNNFLTLGILWCSLRAFTQVPAVLKNNFGGDNPHVFDSDV